MNNIYEEDYEDYSNPYEDYVEEDPYGEDDFYGIPDPNDDYNFQIEENPLKY